MKYRSALLCTMDKATLIAKCGECELLDSTSKVLIFAHKSTHLLTSIWDGMSKVLVVDEEARNSMRIALPRNVECMTVPDVQGEESDIDEPETKKARPSYDIRTRFCFVNLSFKLKCLDTLKETMATMAHCYGPSVNGEKINEETSPLTNARRDEHTERGNSNERLKIERRAF